MFNNFEDALKEVASPKEAEARGYSPITSTYDSSEWQMLDNAIASLVNGGRKLLLVMRIEGHEIWIPKTEVKR